MLRKYGEHYIDISRVVSVSPIKWTNKDVVQYQLSILLEGCGCVLAAFTSEGERDEGLHHILAESKLEDSRAITVCDVEQSHEYVDGFKHGVDYALNLQS